MSDCLHSYTLDGDERSCQRSAVADRDRCVFHLSPDERTAAGVTASSVRAAFLADVESDDPARREYVDVHLAALDLSALVVDGPDVGRLTFRNVTVDGTLDVSRAVLRHPITIQDSHVGRFEATGAAFEMAVTVDGTTFEDEVTLVDADCADATFDRVGSTDRECHLDLTGGSFDRLRIRPGGDLTCRLVDAAVSAGGLGQPEANAARYDLTDATVGDVDLDCQPGTFDRYRFYRTRFDGFHFTEYREVLRANRWRLHEYTGTPASADTIEGLEHTYLEAKNGAASSGDGETASRFQVRELRYQRRRYAVHARTAEHSAAHRLDAAVRWATNGFLDLISGYGERPQRTAALALAVIAGCALAYPAVGGLVTGDETVSYASHGTAALFDGLYFSAVTFATLGLGDVHPAGDLGRFLAASEGLAGAFLTAVFVFSLGRRASR